MLNHICWNPSVCLSLYVSVVPVGPECLFLLLVDGWMDGSGLDNICMLRFHQILGWCLQRTTLLACVHLSDRWQSDLVNHYFSPCCSPLSFCHVVVCGGKAWDKVWTHCISIHLRETQQGRKKKKSASGVICQQTAERCMISAAFSGKDIDQNETWGVKWAKMNKSGRCRGEAGWQRRVSSGVEEEKGLLMFSLLLWKK